MSATPKGAQAALSVARTVGGADGRLLARAVQDSLDAPDLRHMTQTGQIIDNALSAVGGYNPNCIPYETKREMRRDPQVRFGLQSVKSPLIAAPLSFVSRSREVQAILTDVFLNSGFLSELLISSLQAIDFGFIAHEKLWTLEDERTVEWEQPNAEGGVDVKDKTYTNLFTPQRWKDLDVGLTTLLKNKRGEFVGLTFGTYPSTLPSLTQVKEHVKKSKVNVLSAEKTFLFNPICEFQNLRGEGRLEWTYESWYWQRICYMVAMRWYERKADPPYVGYAPNNTGIDTDEDSSGRRSNLALMNEALAKLRSTGQVVLPSEVFMDDEGKPSAVRAWSLEEVKVQDMHPAFLEMIDHYDKKKTRSVWAPDIALSRDRQAGTLGSTEAIMDATTTMQNQTLERWVNMVNREVIQPFLRYNGIKDKAILTTSGVASDNRSAMLGVLTKVLESDMLAEQAWGRIFPGSLTQMVDREGLMRELGIPHRPIDPDAPMPKPAPVEESDPTDPKAGKDNMSNNKDKDAKTNTGGGKAKSGKAADVFSRFWSGDEGYKMDFASNALVRRAQKEAEAAEAELSEASDTMEARETLSTYEKAATAIMLWWLLRSPKTAGDKKVAGDKSVDTLVFSGGKGAVLAPAALAANLPALEAKAAALDGSGLRVAASAPPALAKRARGAITTTMGTLPDAVAATNVAATVEAAAASGQASALSMIQQFGGNSAPAVLSATALASIVQDNLDGTILNIQNVAIRNTQKSVEAILMGAGRELGVEMGLVQDVMGFRFNRNYSDLSLAAHLRSAYRRAHVETAIANEQRFFIKIPAVEFGSEFDYVVGSDGYWKGVGEQTGNPLPHTTFGLHHGSKSYWLLVPANEKIRS